MAERNSSGGGGFSGVLNSLLVLFTVLGGVLLVSQKLTSERPVSATGDVLEPMGRQTLAVRLWEDPFKTIGNSGHPLGNPTEPLTNQILSATMDGQVLLLPVMIPGGAYSEDQEKRIRTRFAVVSALGQRGYEPADAEHIGTVTMNWPTTRELKNWMTNSSPEWETIPKPSSPENIPTNDVTLGGVVIDGTTANSATFEVRIHHEVTNSVDNRFVGSINLPIRFEWYHAGSLTSHSNVLVLWIDDDSFEDFPLVRLPLLLKPLIAATGKSGSGVVPLIGPRRSSTLRAMLNERFERLDLTSFGSSNAWQEARATLNQIEVYSATASAVDGVLITNASDSPREKVRQKLASYGFPDAHFLNATDGQIANEILDELELRRVDFKNPRNHLVLLSEWDTFYGRSLSLTYSAAISDRLSSIEERTNRRQEVDQGHLGNGRVPVNFHPFVYFRGLDGRTVGESATDKEKPGTAKRERYKPGSLEDVVHWRPDANKAEGPGQFDYLSRTGERIEALQRDLNRSNSGEIKAIGIVGSDVYDVLLILQALRARFPTVHFFTTDLDARFWHPTEREWARNLIVASSYGLGLHPDLQRDVALFRDSSQTAIYVATLAALGDRNLAALTNVPPRRFEIGNRTAKDLSVWPGTLQSTNTHADVTNGPWLHPLTLSEVYAAHGDYEWNRPVKLAIYMFMAVLAATAFYYCSPFRLHTPHDNGYLSEHLPFSDADVGGSEGAEIFIETIFISGDPLCLWMVRKFNEDPSNLFPPRPQISLSKIRVPLQLPIASLADPHYLHLIAEKNQSGYDIELNKVRAMEGKHQRNRADTFMAFLNDLLNRETLMDEPSALNSSLLDQVQVARAKPWRAACPWWLGPQRLLERVRTRALLDTFLHRLTFPINSKSQVLVAAEDARHAARKLFGARIHFLIFFLVMVGFVGVLVATMGSAIWDDTFSRATGEPFSITSGTSAWPNVILRWISALMALLFIFVLVEQLRVMFYDLSRRYRIPLTGVNAERKPQSVCASALWQEFYNGGHVLLRLLRSSIPCLLYFCFGMALLSLLGLPFEPLRGKTIVWWADPIRIGPGFHPFIFLSLMLSFMTIDAALRCRRFIKQLSAAPTHYPGTTSAYFRGQRGDVGEEYLDEWIDTQLIADLTERVQGLLWFPVIVFLLTLTARNQWTDQWPTSNGLLIILALNLAISITSIVILQHTAVRAKKQAIESLSAKLKKAQSIIAPTPQHNDVAQAQKLLDEIEKLRRGAFVTFWENPVVSAILLPSGGTAVIQLFAWVAGR